MSVNVVFVVPFAMRTTLKFVTAMADLPGVKLGLLTMDPIERVPAEVRAKISGHWQVDNCFHADQIEAGVRAMAKQMGGVDRVHATLEQLQVPLAEAREKLRLPGTGAAVAMNFREKSRMKDVFRQAGIPCAHHSQVTAESEALEFAERVGFPIVIKPPAGAGSKATSRVNDVNELRQAVALFRPSSANPVLLEEFVVGDEQSFETVSIEGRPVWYSLSHYLPTPLETLENPWVQWCVLVPRETDHPRYGDIKQVSTKAIQALGVDTALTHMEWFRRRDGSLAISEVAMRPPGSHIVTLHSYAHDFDFYSAWARLVVFGEFDPPVQKYATGAAFLRGQGRGRVKAIHGLEEAQRKMGDLVVEVQLPRVGQPQASGYEGEGYAILRHPRTDVVRDGLLELISTVRVEMG